MRSDRDGNLKLLDLPRVAFDPSRGTIMVSLEEEGREAHKSMDYGAGSDRPLDPLKLSDELKSLNTKPTPLFQIIEGAEVLMEVRRKRAADWETIKCRGWRKWMLPLGVIGIP